MSEKEAVLDRIRALDVPHEEWFHEAAHTMEDCLRLPFAAPEVTICKNMLLCNRQQTAYYFYITLWNKRFRTADVSRLLGVSRLSFAPEEALTTLLRTESGSLAPFGLWYDTEKRIRFVVDEAVLQTERIAFHPCDNTATVVFSQRDFWDRIVPTLGHPPVFLKVPSAEAAGSIQE